MILFANLEFLTCRHLDHLDLPDCRPDALDDAGEFIIDLIVDVFEGRGGVFVFFFRDIPGRI